MAERLTGRFTSPIRLPESPLEGETGDLIRTGSSTMVFQALQEGHWPAHLADSYPHS